jgi:hypothetical protein
MKATAEATVTRSVEEDLQETATWLSARPAVADVFRRNDRYLGGYVTRAVLWSDADGHPARARGESERQCR